MLATKSLCIEGEVPGYCPPPPNCTILVLTDLGTCYILPTSYDRGKLVVVFSCYLAKNAAIGLADEVLRYCDHDTSRCQDDIS